LRFDFCCASLCHFNGSLMMESPQIANQTQQKFHVGAVVDAAVFIGFAIRHQ